MELESKRDDAPQTTSCCIIVMIKLKSLDNVALSTFDLSANPNRLFYRRKDIQLAYLVMNNWQICCFFFLNTPLYRHQNVT